MKRFKNRLRYDYKAAGNAKRTGQKNGLKARLGHLEPEDTRKDPDPVKFEEELEQEEDVRQKKGIQTEKRKRSLARGIQILLAIWSVYTVFLIYGLLVTEYQYDEAGNVVPKIVTVEEIESREVFELLYRHYLQARMLYEDVLRLDYKLSLDEESKLVAMEYEELLDQVSALTVSVDALSVGTKYGQIKNMLLEWVKTDTAVYLQNISAAILQNNENKANEALACRTQMYNDFLILTENMAALGETIPGVDIASIYTWSPESFISEVLEGVRRE